jgi:hypothetical protein
VCRWIGIRQDVFPVVPHWKNQTFPSFLSTGTISGDVTLILSRFPPQLPKFHNSWRDPAVVYSGRRSVLGCMCIIIQACLFILIIYWTLRVKLHFSYTHAGCVVGGYFTHTMNWRM